MKTQEELNAIKEEVEALSEKLAELTEEELKQVAGSREPEDIGWKSSGFATPRQDEPEGGHIFEPIGPNPPESNKKEIEYIHIRPH